MTKGMQPIRAVDVNAALEGVILPRLADVLQAREDGHCMRVDDVPTELMVSLCRRLREAAPGLHVYVLRGEDACSVPDEVGITATKLIEIRNPDSDRQIRRPMLVFVPRESRTAAEDSFAPSTFEQVVLSDAYERLEQQILDGMTNGLPGAVIELLGRLRSSGWPWVTSGNVIRFLLAVRLNGNTPDTVGPALCELGLVPDFGLMENPGEAPARLERNIRAMRALTYSDKSDHSRVLSLGLAEPGFRKELAGFLASAGLADPLPWTRRIAYERSAWQYSFDKWRFEEEITVGRVHVEVTNLTVPSIPEDTGDDRIQHLVGQPFLPVGKDGLRKFSVTFQVAPRPNTVAGLARFVARVVSREHGPTSLTKTRKAGKQEKITITFSRLHQVAWDEGWHYIRIEALTEDGDPLPLVDADGRPLPWESDETAHMSHPNYSVPFFVLPDGEIEEPPPQRAVPRFGSLTHAIMHYALSSEERCASSIEVSDVRWEQEARRTARGGTDQVSAMVKKIGKIHIPVSRVLKVVEQQILAEARGALSWRLVIANGAAGDVSAAPGEWPQLPELPAFLDARQSYFQLLRSQDAELITQATDWREAREVAIAYGGAYLSVLDSALLRASSGSEHVRKSAMRGPRTLLSVDTVLLTLQSSHGDAREAGLVSPTHPLRALWFAAWAEVGESWSSHLGPTTRQYATRVRDALLEKLVPSNVPPVMTTSHGRQFTAVDNIAACWTLYAPPGDNDPRGLLGLVCSALGLREPSIGGSLVSGKALAKRVERYVAQHPYVRQLQINAFNPGRATVLADMLLALQADENLSPLRYDIRLFAPTGRQTGLGSALAELLSPASSVTAMEADAFATASANPLYPKLRYAAIETGAFKDAPRRYTAHLSFLFDVFPATEVGAQLCDPELEVAPVHGLCQDFHVEYDEDARLNTATWRRVPRHGHPTPVPEGDEVVALLSSVNASLSKATAAVATGEAGPGRRPSMTLSLQPEDRALIHQVHEVSDWVLTADRNIGIEFFDHGGTRGRPEYLIDHSPDMDSSLGHRLVVTSRSLAEIEALLGPILKQYGLPAERRHAVAVLDQLRSLSGRLALKLLSAPTQKAEALGLALTRCYLDMQGVFADQIILPLDAHLDLYTELKLQAEELGDAVSLKRTDLALFDLNAHERTITCNLVEVKCYQSTGDMAAYTALKERIRDQLTETEKVIQWHFDPHRASPDRPDRVLKTKELTTILRFYLDRTVRYGLMAADVAAEARFLLETAEDGYRLLFTRSGVIFDFEQKGVGPAENEAGIEFHRIGFDQIRELVSAAGDMVASRAESSSRASLAEEPRARTLSALTSPALPRLETAAFLAQRREHTVPAYPGVAMADRDVQSKATPHVPPEPTTDEPTPEAPRETAPAEEVGGHRKEGAVETTEASQGAGSETTKKPGRPQAGSLHADVLLGATSPSPQFGIIGEANARKVALDLNETHTISLFGVQGGGKSYTLGAVMEMACLQIPAINVLPKPLATVVFHYSPTQDYRPEFTSMSQPNAEGGEVADLLERYGAGPMPLRDIVLLAPRDKLELRRQEYSEIAVLPLTFAASELDVVHWQFLMGTVGNPSAYVRQMRQVMRKLRNEGNLTFESLRAGIASSNMPDNLKDMASMRLDFAGQYVTDEHVLSTVVQPGRLIIVDLRDELIEKDEALGLFVVLMQLFSDARCAQEHFNKLVVFDEAHKYIESSELTSALIQVVREMRHKGTSVLIASQDPPSVPVSLIELSSQVILHRFNSPAWLKHIQKANAALGSLTAEKMASLGPGQAYIWSSKATDDSFSRQAIRIQCRPRVTQHGGVTKTAVSAEPPPPLVIQLPFYPTLKMACGAFAEGRLGHDAEMIRVLRYRPGLDPQRHFVVRAEGDSMDGGNAPIRDGDYVLLEWQDAGHAGSVSGYGRPWAVEYRSDFGDTSYVLKIVKKNDDGAYRLVSRAPGYADIPVDPECFFPRARFVSVLPAELATE